MKVDLKKAYNKIDWRFLENTLNNMKFPLHSVKIIMACVLSSSMRVIWEGEQSSSFEPIKGIQQGV